MEKIEAGDKIRVNGNFETVVERLGEPDRSHETGRIYQEVYFKLDENDELLSHEDIKECELIEKAS